MMKQVYSFAEFSRGERFILGWQYQFLGSFLTKLAEVMVIADSENLAAFALGFPEEAEAMRKYKQESGWWEDLEARYDNFRGRRGYGNA